MMGLLDILQSDDPAVKQGILQFGLGLLSSKGNFGNAVGNAGQQGILGAQQVRDRQAQQKRMGLQDQLTQYQLDQQKRTQELQNLPGQFFQPGGQALPGPQPEDAAGPLQANPSMDMQGYLTALQGKDPMAALQLQQAMAKPLSKFSTTVQYDEKGQGFVLDEQGNKKYTGTSAYEKPQYEASPEVTKLIAARNALPAGHPDRRLYDAAITKASTHQPAITVANYGPPVPVQLADGSTVLVQPSNREGAPPKLMTLPGSAAPLRPAKDPNGDKPLTESQGNATSFAARMRDASSVLAPLEAKGIGSGDVAVMAADSNLTNWASNPEARQYAQGARNWVTANLRKESGAAIPASEMAQELKKYFPQPGEDEATRKQKAQARAVAEEGMMVQAGPGAKQVQGILSRSGSKAATKQGDIHSQADAILRGQ